MYVSNSRSNWRAKFRGRSRGHGQPSPKPRILTHPLFAARHTLEPFWLDDTSEGATAFDDLVFQTRPIYRGTPWFLAGAVLYYRLCDRLAR